MEIRKEGRRVKGRHETETHKEWRTAIQKYKALGIQIDRQADRETLRHRDKETWIHRYIEKDGQGVINTDRLRDTEILRQSTYEQLTISGYPSATVERHWPVKMRASFLLLLCVVLLATTAFANEAESDAASVYKQAEKSENGEVHRVKRVLEEEDVGDKAVRWCS
ncbi:hypothetical protein LSAT2_020785 [Lamellibrachia satsuma]|nr:hypothetical protein LSAT2_020785 [Lamellibrachia satsuma]